MGSTTSPTLDPKVHVVVIIDFNVTGATWRPDSISSAKPDGAAGLATGLAPPVVSVPFVGSNWRSHEKVPLPPRLHPGSSGSSAASSRSRAGLWVNAVGRVAVICATRRAKGVPSSAGLDRGRHPD